MIFDFYNPGTLGTSDAVIRGITVTALDGTGAVIAPASVMSGAKIINSSTLSVCGYVNLSAYTSAAPFYVPADLVPLLVPYSNTVSAY
ncbi:hypothetical protein LZP69_16320, partial [Shewanella sp. AS1]|uniref:hypothetical protein n=1 Tax=Shewanella sp. AS1 TaxID=2907626 RepID=UPI001F24F85B